MKEFSSENKKIREDANPGGSSQIVGASGGLKKRWMQYVTTNILRSSINTVCNEYRPHSAADQPCSVPEDGSIALGADGSAREQPCLIKITHVYYDNIEFACATLIRPDWHFTIAPTIILKPCSTHTEYISWGLHVVRFLRVIDRSLHTAYRV